MKSTKSIVIGTAGHIDHGKTALVRSLTGIDTDRLPEEKRRGITIDLGFAALDILEPGSASRLSISFVDVPGHALFIRNMLAGAGCVPAVMLVIAADEGVMPQTREHLAICDLLGISDGFTVIAKSDLVSESQLAEVRSEIAAFLRGTFLGGAQNSILPASAHNGGGIEEVRAELAKLATRVKVTEGGRPARLPIDRAFVKKGFGTVVTGTLLSGELRAGQTLALEPGARKVRARGLQTHGESEETAEAGTRVAVNLAGVETGEIARGQTLVIPGELAAIDIIDAEVKLLENAPPLKNRARVHLHAFTSETMATVSLYDNEAMKPGTTRLARLKLAGPMVLVPGDRFVLRQSLPAGTIGGGRVLDADPLPRQRRSETASWLERLATSSPSQSLALRVQRRGSSGIAMETLARELGLTISATRALAKSVQADRDIMAITDHLLISRINRDDIAELVTQLAKNAGAPGMKRSELRSQTELPAEILNAVVDDLVAGRTLLLSGEVVTLPGAGSAAANKDDAKMLSIDNAYENAGLAPASVRDVAQSLRMPEPEMRRLVTLLLREKKLVRMDDDDTFVHAGVLKNLTSRLAAQRGKTLDVAAFKALTGLTRKHAIPLLELLDRERITRKQGDVRLVL